MILLVSLTAVALCIIVSESKERTASLVVLPPLVIGYDELYNDSQENGKNVKDQATAKNAMFREGEGELDRLVEYTKTEMNEQRGFRDAIIDVKGRRGNFRRRIASSNVNKQYNQQSKE